MEPGENHGRRNIIQLPFWLAALSAGTTPTRSAGISARAPSCVLHAETFLSLPWLPSFSPTPPPAVVKNLVTCSTPTQEEELSGAAQPGDFGKQVGRAKWLPLT